MTGLRLAPDKTGGQGGAPNLQSPDYVSTGGKGDLSENWSTISLNSSAHTTPASYKKGKVSFPFSELNIIYIFFLYLINRRFSINLNLLMNLMKYD